MRVAVISDTHNRLPESLLATIFVADEIWHLGDVTDEGILLRLKGSGKPVKVVRGNCDSCRDWPLHLDFVIAGLKIRLIHIPPGPAPVGFDLVLHGHTHVPRSERIGQTHFLNPGCITRPNRGAPPSYAWLTLEDGLPFSWKVYPVP